MPYDSAFGQMMNNVFGGFDMAIFSFFSFFQNDIFTFLAKAFTCIGEPSFVIMYGFLSIILLFFKRTRKIGFLICLALGFYLLLNDFIFKYVFTRLRPYNALQGNSEFFNWYMNVGAVPESPYCFPSGHCCCTFAVATVLFLWIKNDMKRFEAWLIFLLPVFVALSRVYLMVHYATDVIAGSIEGILIGIFVWYLVKLCIKSFKFYPQKLRDINSFDLEPWLEKKIKHKLVAKNVTIVIVLILICFGITTFTKFNFEIQNVPKCEHNGPDFICRNEGKYQSFDDQTKEFHYYCEQHEDERN